MRPIKFFVSCVAVFILLAASYAFVIDRWAIPGQKLPVPYNQFLLESTASIEGKVVIDSGSNSIHSFDTQILSDYFLAPVIIVADTAGKPLRYKIFNLINYLNSGDILILPLEWGNYSSKEEFSVSFLENVIQKRRAFDYYINGLPFTEKLDFIFRKLPFKMTLDSFLDNEERTALRSETTFNRLDRFEKRLKNRNNTSFGGVVRDGPEKIHFAAFYNSCDKYIFGDITESEFGKVSEIFVSDLDVLEKLAEEGVSIYFTWPVVVDAVGKDCYGDPLVRERIQSYTDSIADIVESRGFKFLGVPSDSHFDSECFLNTFYHIRYSCALERTRSFVATLKQQGVAPLNTSINQAEMGEVIEDYIRNRREEEAGQFPPLAEGVVATLDQEKNIFFRSGWSSAEKTGTWSIGTESVFQLRLVPGLLKQEYVYLGIDGHYFNGEEMTKVEINGVSYGAEILRSHVFRVSTNTILDRRVTVRLRHSDVRSPKMLGQGEGTRMIKFKLQTVSLSQSKSD